MYNKRSYTILYLLSCARRFRSDLVGSRDRHLRGLQASSVIEAPGEATFHTFRGGLEVMLRLIGSPIR